MSKLTLRVKSQEGSGVIKLDSKDSLEKLVTHSLECIGLETTDTASIKILTGFPPKGVDLTDRDKSIESSGIRTGDTLIFEISKPPSSSNPIVDPNTFAFGSTRSGSTSSSKNKTTSNSSSSKENTLPTHEHAQLETSEAKRLKSSSTKSSSASTKTSNSSISNSSPRDSNQGLLRKVVPADNSCLFTAINFCMSGEVVDSKHSSFMREIIGETVRGDKEKYSEAFLGRDNDSYYRWIMTTEAWGGAIEVQILAEYFQVEIVVADTKSGSLTRFGESCNFRERMILIYDGIHYDPLYLNSNGVTAKTIFSSSDDSMLDLAKQFAQEAKATHNYTDTAGFSLKCLVCGSKLKGATEAQSHAQDTGHTNFSEV